MIVDVKIKGAEQKATINGIEFYCSQVQQLGAKRNIFYESFTDKFFLTDNGIFPRIYIINCKCSTQAFALISQALTEEAFDLYIPVFGFKKGKFRLLEQEGGIVKATTHDETKIGWAEFTIKVIKDVFAKNKLETDKIASKNSAIKKASAFVKLKDRTVGGLIAIDKLTTFATKSIARSQRMLRVATNKVRFVATKINNIMQFATLPAEALNEINLSIFALKSATSGNVLKLQSSLPRLYTGVVNALINSFSIENAVNKTTLSTSVQENMPYLLPNISNDDVVIERELNKENKTDANEIEVNNIFTLPIIFILLTEMILYLETIADEVEFKRQLVFLFDFIKKLSYFTNVNDFLSQLSLSVYKREESIAKTTKGFFDVKDRHICALATEVYKSISNEALNKIRRLNQHNTTDFQILNNTIICQY